MHEQDDQVTVGSGNVFRDTGASDPESRMAKVDLVSHIMDIVDEHHWTQKEAAERFGIDQPNMSRILAGKLRGFSIDRLLQLLANAGYNVGISLEHVSNGRQHGTISISRLNDETPATYPIRLAVTHQSGRQKELGRPVDLGAEVLTEDA